LNDKEFILELIQSNPKILNGLDKNAGVVKDKDFILQAVKSIK
jgi:hypothetical protein